MFSSLLSTASPALIPHAANILGALKRSHGLSMPELSEEVKLSYMAATHHCKKLIDAGFIETWRQPRESVGRPVKIFRLTKKAEIFFPTADATFALQLLKQSGALFGQSAPERILLRHFQDEKSTIAPKVRGSSIAEKATWLTDFLQKRGYFWRCDFDSTHGFHIRDYHHPLKPVLEAYPAARRFEIQFLEQALGSKIQYIPADRKQPVPRYVLGTLGRA